MESRTNRQMRSIGSQFTTREDGDGLIIEGHFAVFDKDYIVWPGMSESIAPGAFAEALEDDIRALINHDSTLVLGRNKAGTLKLEEDADGLWGQIRINPNDQDAMNLYERVKRGDVDQCSFGFDILDETTDVAEDGAVHWTIKRVKLYEVSVCTFPAYEDTAVTARSAEVDQLKRRELEAWRETMNKKLKGE